MAMLRLTAPQFRFIRAGDEEEMLRQLHIEGDRGWMPVALTERVDGGFGVLLRGEDEAADDYEGD